MERFILALSHENHPDCPCCAFPHEPGFSKGLLHFRLRFLSVLLVQMECQLELCRGIDIQLKRV